MGTTERRVIVWAGWSTKPVADGRTYALLITHAACGQILIRPGGCRKHYEQRSRRPRNTCKGERNCIVRGIVCPRFPTNHRSL
jgi:hypothetical protein